MAMTLDALVRRVEGRTGVQVATAVVGKSDSYAELPWMAFALGVSVSALAAGVGDLLWPQWVMAGAAAVQGALTLSAGGALALLAVFVPPFARLFLRATRGEVEVRQYGESLFLRHGLFDTERRTAVLVLISRFERRVEILPDTGVQARVPVGAWHGVVERMAPCLKRGSPADALSEGLEAIESLLVAHGFSGVAGAPNELPDAPIEEEGA
jgi:putative membrane protein